MKIIEKLFLFAHRNTLHLDLMNTIGYCDGDIKSILMFKSSKKFNKLLGNITNYDRKLLRIKRENLQNSFSYEAMLLTLKARMFQLLGEEKNSQFFLEKAKKIVLTNSATINTPANDFILSTIDYLNILNEVNLWSKSAEITISKYKQELNNIPLSTLLPEKLSYDKDELIKALEEKKRYFSHIENFSLKLVSGKMLNDDEIEMGESLIKKIEFLENKLENFHPLAKNEILKTNLISQKIKIKFYLNIYTPLEQDILSYCIGMINSRINSPLIILSEDLWPSEIMPMHPSSFQKSYIKYIKSFALERKILASGDEALILKKKISS